MMDLFPKKSTAVVALSTLLALTGCATGLRTDATPKTPDAMVAASPQRAAPSTSLAVSGAVQQPMRLDLAALKALPATTQSVAGHAYTGVALWTLLSAHARLKPDAATRNGTLSMYAVLTGTDGYKTLVSIGEIDPDYGGKAALVAYAIDGGDLGRNGMARLVMPGDQKMSRWVASLASIEVFTTMPPR